jgi:hypothetical protein
MCNRKQTMFFMQWMRGCDVNDIHIRVCTQGLIRAVRVRDTVLVGEGLRLGLVTRAYGVYGVCLWLSLHALRELMGDGTRAEDTPADGARVGKERCRHASVLRQFWMPCIFMKDDS